MPKIQVRVTKEPGVGFPDFERLRRQFLVELARLVNSELIPQLRRASRYSSGKLRRSWRVKVSPVDGLPDGIVAVFYWTVQENKQEFFDITNRMMPSLVRRAARAAARAV